jgi:REP element-mobilizing transposase RayT
VHLIWSTKERKPMLTKPARYQIFKHMLENARSKGIYLDHVNGHFDHVHCLVSLEPEQSIAYVAQMIKGESAFWVNNKSGLLNHKLEWGKSYYAVSHGRSSLNTVRRYIQRQEQHHKAKTLLEECEEFMRLYGFDYVLE